MEHLPLCGAKLDAAISHYFWKGKTNFPDSNFTTTKYLGDTWPWSLGSVRLKFRKSKK